MLGEGQQNTALENAPKIAYDDIERAFLQAADEAPPVPKENAPGSYERLMAGFAQLEARGKTL